LPKVIGKLGYQSWIRAGFLNLSTIAVLVKQFCIMWRYPAHYRSIPGLYPLNSSSLTLSIYDTKMPPDMSNGPWRTKLPPIENPGTRI
jgi:hypothetical protein